MDDLEIFIEIVDIVVDVEAQRIFGTPPQDIFSTLPHRMHIEFQ